MLRNLKELAKKLLKRPESAGPRSADPPKDPYAPVPAPTKPRRPQLSGSVALVEPDEN